MRKVDASIVNYSLELLKMERDVRTSNVARIKLLIDMPNANHAQMA